MAGFRFFSAGQSWEAAFEEAARFLERGEGTLLLGPSIGDSGAAWIRDRSLGGGGVRFGNRVQPWREWVKARARSHALAEGKGFRILNTASKREVLRKVAEFFGSNEAFHHIGGIWSEERFFSGLLDCITEARCAGLFTHDAIMLARETLARGEDAVVREVYDDLWALLLKVEEKLHESEETLLDDALLLRFAAANEASTGPLFLLGFDEFSLLEVDLLQAIGRRECVHVPLALPRETIADLLLEKAVSLDHPVSLALRGLVTGFSGERTLAGEADPEIELPRLRLLEAHSPADEAAAAAALARAALAGSVNEVRFVVPPDYFSDRSVSLALREELGLPVNFVPRRALEHPVARLFFHVLELKERDFALAHGLELAALLKFSTGRFGDLPSRATRAGVRRGLADWKRKAGSDRELQEFAATLERIDRLLPSEGSAEDFALALEEVAEATGVAELARRAPGDDSERDAHAALSGVLRNAQMLAAHTRARFTFSAWMAELRAALAGSLTGEVLSLFPLVQFYSFGEWLPPAHSGSLTLVLGLTASAGPRAGFQFYLEEAARRKLSDLLLPTQVQRGLGFIDFARRCAGSRGAITFSFPKHSAEGKEQEPSWVTGALPLAAEKWPEVPRESTAAPFRASAVVRTGDPGLEALSASLLETYKECPFKAFADRVLGLEDKVQESSLDVSRLEEGTFVHRSLELFYGDRNGKDLTDPAERERVLRECMAEAAGELKRKAEYYRGNESLLENQVRRLATSLLEFVESDAAHYARFPFFTKPKVELSVEGSVAGIPWRGKIDRVDFDEAQRRFVVTDYKIGGNPPANKELEELRRFQLQLYSDAVEEKFPGWSVAGAQYASVTSGKRGTGMLLKPFNHAGKTAPKPGEVKYFAVGGSSGALLEPEEFEELRARSRVEAARLAGEISAGNFPVEPLDEEVSCKRCSVRPACRIRELRSPPREPASRPAPRALLALLEPPPAVKEKERRAREFNPEQRSALDRRGELVFIEASAGTGKTTVIVERIRLFLEERTRSEAPHVAVERFAAISFTEKSAQELRARLARSLLQDPAFGARVASQAEGQVSTIHGFCRRVLGDFPVEAGVSPLAAMLDQKGADSLRAEVLEGLFLFPSEEAAPLLEKAYAEFSRATVERLLVRLAGERALLEDEVAALRAGGASGKIFPEGAARATLLAVLDLSEIFRGLYEKRKREGSVLDFDDLEALTLKVLESPHAREFYRKKLELLLVDEFQDTNAVQRKIFERLARPEWSNLFVVGDAKQSIYRFRAADVSVFQGLRREADAKGRLVTLGRNYRSASEIVAAANQITKAIFPSPGEEAPDFEAFDAPAIAEVPSGGKVALVEFGHPEEKLNATQRREMEAKIVARLVTELRARGTPPKSIALLLRKVNGNEAFLRALTDAGIPYRVGSSKGFYGQSAITDSIALLRVLFGARNDLALLAVLRSPWCRLSDAKILEIERRSERRVPLFEKLQPADAPALFAWVEKSSHASLAGMLELAHADYPASRREQLQVAKLVSLVDKLEAEARPRAEILESLSAWSGWDREDDSSDDSVMPEPALEGIVQVMTVHAAKGLEFEVTLLADLCAGRSPDNDALRAVRGAGIVLKLESERGGPGGAASKQQSEPYTEIGRANAARDLAELKRLFYVAATRAQKEEYFFLPRWFEAKDRAKWDSCGHFLRAADLSGIAEKIDGDSYLLRPPAKSAARVAEASAIWPPRPEFPRFRESSITEIAAFQFCPEFHRRKYVQAWDDRIVEMWPKPAGSFKKIAWKADRPKDPETERVSKLLKKLKLERKERGIALHRVLERIPDAESGLGQAELWLREAYEAQGANGADPRLAELISLDLGLLRHFLASPLGRKVFDARVEAYPEIAFEWKVGGVHLHGAMDRLIRNQDGTWTVVDYKSSILEESFDRYRFQVASYMAAVSFREQGAGRPEAHVEGYLVDLYAASSHAVDSHANDAAQHLAQELQKTAANYTQSDTKRNLVGSAVTGGDHCFSCPYSLHCEIGARIVLASK